MCDCVVAAFKMIEGNQALLQRIVYFVGNLLGLALAIYKCQVMGLLPTHPSDWLAFVEPQQVCAHQCYPVWCIGEATWNKVATSLFLFHTPTKYYRNFHLVGLCLFLTLKLVLYCSELTILNFLLQFECFTSLLSPLVLSCHWIWSSRILAQKKCILLLLKPSNWHEPLTCLCLFLWWTCEKEVCVQ